MGIIALVLALVPALAPLGTRTPGHYPLGSQAGRPDPPLRLARTAVRHLAGGVRGMAGAGCRAGSKVRAPHGSGRVHIWGIPGVRKEAKCVIING